MARCPRTWRRSSLLLITGLGLICASPAAAETWRVGLKAHDPPYSEFAPDASDAMGLYVEWWRSLAEVAGADLELRPCADLPPGTRAVPEPACVELLESGAVDFLGPRGFLDDPSFEFSRPVHRRHVVAVARAGTIDTPDDLRDRKVVLLDTAAREQTTLLEFGPSVVDTRPEALALEALADRTHDAVVLSGVGAPGFTAVPEMERKSLWFRWQHIYALGGHRDELARIDTLIDELNPSYDRLGQPWLLVGEDELLLRKRDRPSMTYETLALLDAHPLVRLGAAAWPPLTVFENGEFDGLALRVVSHHLHRAGMTPIFQGDADWRVVRARALAGELDGLGYVVASPNAPKRLVYTDSMIDLPMVVVTRIAEDFWTRRDDLRGRRVVYNPMYGEAQLKLEHLSKDHLFHEKEGARALALLRGGTVDAWVEFLPVAREVIHRAGATDVKLAFRIGGPEDARTAFQAHLSPLISLIDHSIRTTEPGDLDALYAKWSHRDETPVDTSTVLRWPVFMVIGLLLVGLVIQSRQVRREHRTVRQRERALRRAQVLSGVGSFEIYPPYDQILLDGETPRLLGLPDHEEWQSLEDHLRLFQDPESLRKALRECRDANKPIRFDVITRDTPEQIFDYELAPPQRVDGGKDVIVGTLENVTEDRARAAHEKELEEEVLHLQKLEAIGRLAGGIAHDFNNVLAATMANAELARGDLEPSHPARESVDQVLKASERARDLVQQMLAFSRRHAEKHQPLRMDRCVTEAVNFMRASIPATVDIVVRVDPEPVWIRGDESRLTQVLVNLITNAVDAIQDHGRIVLSLEARDTASGERVPGDRALGLAQLVVEDDGPGIDAKIRGQIFDPFFTTKPVGKGTGLGLSIVHGVVRAHGGTTEVECREGGGARFVILLPIDEAPVITEEKFVPLLRGKGQSILVVDDEVALTTVYHRVLSQCGLHVSAFTSARRAKEVFDRDPGRFDLVVTDLTMPGLTGEKLARSLLASRPSLPILLLTGFGGDDARARWSHLFREVLRKPVPTEHLVRAVLAQLEPDVPLEPIRPSVPSPPARGAEG